MAYSGAFRPYDREEPLPEAERAETAGKRQERPPRPNEGLTQRLMPLLKKLEAIDLETEDLLLLLILYLMYRESGEKELLIMMGAMLFA